MVHELKTHPKVFGFVKSQIKKFEIRKNDRNFQIGDEILLREFEPKGHFVESKISRYTGNFCHRKITYILADEIYGLQPGYVILGIEPI